MKAVILCGGLGTRLKEETEFRPKPMVPIGGMPILWHIMKTYSHYGVRDFVLCLGYKGEMIRQFFTGQELQRGGSPAGGSAVPGDWNIIFADTGLNSMTGAHIKRVQKYVPEDEFFLTYGDGLANVDIGALAAHHRKAGRIGTITGVNMPSRFGLIKTNSKGIVTKFVEKPILDDFVNGGYFAFRKDVFDYVSEDEGCVFEAEPLSKLADEGQLSLYHHTGFWYPMDTYRDYTELNRMWDEGKRPWKVW